MTKTTFLVTIVLLASTFLISCNNAETKVEPVKPTFSLADARKQIDEANKNFMDFFAKGDSAGIANLYTADAKVMFTGAPSAVGKAAIQSVFGGYIKEGVTKVDLKTIELFGNEDLLAEEGAVTIYVKEAVVAEEKYIGLWKKEEGKWKLFRDISNSNSAK
jgi:uncharacterized protein (TIGR02246 family)